MTSIIDQTHKYLVYSSWYQRKESDIKYLTIHHSAWPQNEWSNEQRLHEMKNWHHKKKWPGLSYHYAIMRDGEIYKLNKHEDVTWHDTRNTDTLGILVDGYFHPTHNEKPSSKQLKSLDWLTKKLLTDLKMERSRIRGHKDWSPTACPGDLLYPTVKILQKKPLNNSTMSDKQAALKTVHDFKSPFIFGKRRKRLIDIINANDWSQILFEYKVAVDHVDGQSEEISQLKLALDEDNRELVAGRQEILKQQSELDRMQTEVKNHENALKVADKSIAQLQALLANQKRTIEELQAEPEKWNWDKFKVGLSKYAWIQSLIGVIVTTLVAWLIQYVPELENYRSEIIGGFLLIFGISSAGQNGVQVVKNINS